MKANRFKTTLDATDLHCMVKNTETFVKMYFFIIFFKCKTDRKRSY